MKKVDLSKQTVNLSKSETINLSKSSEGLKKVMIGLGWDEANKNSTVKKGLITRLLGKSSENSFDFDLDAWICFMKDDKTITTSKVYYGNRDISHKGVNFVHHCGDNLTGEGEGDDEQIIVDLSNIPSKFNGLVIGVTIFRGSKRNQSFGDIKNIFVRVVDQNNEFEICRYAESVSQQYKDCTTFIVGKIYNDKGDWKFKANGYGTKDEDIFTAVDNYRG